MAVVWLGLCAVHTVLTWPVRGMELLLGHLAPGMILVAWRADGGEGEPPDVDD
jgi:hypothetical protein